MTTSTWRGAGVSSLNLLQSLEMLAECFNEPIEQLKPETLRDQVPGWDSMGALLLIAELDERFGLELSAERSRGMKKISDLLDFLREQGVLADS
jgi:acyl carrier protein